MPDCRLLNYLRQRAGGKEGVCNGLVDTSAWGFATSVCNRHHAMAKALLENNANELPGKLTATGDIAAGYVPRYVLPAAALADYIKLFALMQTTEAVDSQIAKLAAELSGAIDAQKRHRNDLDIRFRNGRGFKGAIRLSRVLNCYEGLCWFPMSNAVFAGALSTNDFNTSLRLGLMAKDPGAGRTHGDLSHRLQWHAVMRVITQDFTRSHGGDWAHSALELFTSMGANPWAQRNIWGAVFDAQGMPNYSDPSNLYAELRKKNYGVLADKLDRTHQKRLDVEKACEEEWKELWADGRLQMLRFKYMSDERLLAQKLKITPRLPDRSEIASTAYAWKKQGGPGNRVQPAWEAAIFASVDTVAKVTAVQWYDAAPALPADVARQAAAAAVVTKLTELAALRFWRKHIAEGGDVPNAVPTHQTMLRGTGVFETEGIMQDPSGEQNVDMVIAGRIVASRAGLSDFYKYSPDVGARRAF